MNYIKSLEDYEVLTGPNKGKKFNGGVDAHRRRDPNSRPLRGPEVVPPAAVAVEPEDAAARASAARVLPRPALPRVKPLSSAVEAVPQTQFKVGDEVEWESRGVLQWEGGKKISRIEKHPSKDEWYAFVEGINTGIPMEQLQMSKARAR